MGPFLDTFDSYFAQMLQLGLYETRWHLWADGAVGSMFRTVRHGIDITEARVGITVLGARRYIVAAYTVVIVRLWMFIIVVVSGRLQAPWFDKASWTVHVMWLRLKLWGGLTKTR